MRKVDPIAEDKPSRFSDETWADMVSLGEIHSYAIGDRVHEQGELDQRLMLLLSGQACLLRHDGESENSYGVYMKSGDVLSGSTVHINVPKFFSTEVTEANTRVLTLTDADVRKLCMAHEDFLRFILEGLSIQLYTSLEVLRREREMPAEKRIALRLLELAEQHPDIKSTQAELGNRMGTSRITVSKCLSELEKQKLIRRHYGYISVLDPDGIRAWIEE